MRPGNIHSCRARYLKRNLTQDLKIKSSSIHNVTNRLHRVVCVYRAALCAACTIATSWIELRFPKPSPRP
ncbi:hypothetical protein BDV29DRAFT_185490 [Aspergillus leporis]|uniref:Uncharacterized protein n=1 Tax=Aspergillus leporis TaxID=41062 RepID=A0A5N5WHD1_9EURO|nr:hypothetical protein BDV29DRAFT_185490 [Aspergillus leporis]